MKNYAFLLILASCLLIACQKQNKEADSASDPIVYELIEAWHTDTSLRVPESVIYDADRDVLYVSNMNNEPRLKDENGFISKLSTSGEILDLEWVSNMSSPKGMAITDNMLYVTDVDEIIVIDIENAVITEKIKIEGSLMLNDIAPDGSGNLYISDSDNHTIHKLSNGEVSTWMSEGLDRPNGLYVDGSRILLASSGSSDLTSIDTVTKVKTLLVEGIGNGDGIAYTGKPGYFLVSDWYGEIFLVDADQKNKTSLLKTKDQEIYTADIEFITAENLLLVPTFYDQRVVAYKLAEKEQD